LTHGAEIISGYEIIMQIQDIAGVKHRAEVRVQMLRIFAEPGGSIHQCIV
jgi:hypothetical protein